MPVNIAVEHGGKNKMTLTEYIGLEIDIIQRGFIADIKWARSLKPCDSYISFFNEYAFVICNSGMKWQIARKIYDNIIEAIETNQPISSVFKHKGKVAAIEMGYANKRCWFQRYLKAKTVSDKLDYLQSLPWIGPITKYHLAKNLGLDSVKPDRHLVRVAEKYDTTPLKMCQKLAKQTGLTLSEIDTVIWRAAVEGLI